jgi:serine/threonine-protein kinase
VHAANLVHRDVKPGNGFLDSDNSVRLGDLGMASAVGTDGSAPPDGTLATVAPEVLGPTGRCTVRSDVYSLGATIFYLLTGEYPVDHRQPRVTMADQIVVGRRRKLRDLAPQVSLSLGWVVERALSTDPAARQPTALALANQLSGCRHYPRVWQQVAVHPGHQMCFRGGIRQSAQAVEVCVIPTSSNEADIRVMTAGGTHVRRHERSAVRMNRIVIVLRKLLPDV